MQRAKMGFGIPIENWLNKELKALVLDYLGEKKLREHNLFNISEVQDIVQDFFKGRKEKYLKVWYLLMFQMWYEKWV
jgi:asparagine synthase (glutamine-hydrolysing)